MRTYVVVLRVIVYINIHGLTFRRNRSPLGNTAAGYDSLYGYACSRTSNNHSTVYIVHSDVNKNADG